MRFAWASALKDLRQLRRDPVVLGVWLGFPAIVCAMLLFLFGRGDTTPQGKLLIVDEEGSLISSQLPGAFSQGELGRMFTVEKVTRRDGQAKIARGDGSALLVIPKGFGDAVFQGTPSRLRLVTNPAQSILPQIAGETISMLPEAVFYIQALAGDRLRTLASGTQPPDQVVAEASVAFNRLGTQLSGFLDPRRIDLQTVVTETSSTNTSNIGAVFIPSMLFLTVLFLAAGFTGEIWKERRQAVLRRLLTTPGRLELFLAGRALSLGIVLAVASTGAVLTARLKLTVDAPAAISAVLFTVLCGVSLYMLLQLLVVYAPGERAAHVLTNLLLFPLAILGGSFFPFEMMPQWMASIGRMTPNGWAVAELGAILAGKSNPADAMLVSLRLLGLAAIAFLVVTRRLRKGFAL